MKPPECVICGKQLESGHGELLSFERSESDEEWFERSEEEGHVGHPPNAEWFCNEHAVRAHELMHLTLEDALERY